MRVLSLLFFLLCGTGLLFAEHFIVKKTKQMVVSYADQWCEQFGRFLQLCADFDAHRSVMQKQGVKEILSACESGTAVDLAQLPAEDQKRLVQKLRTLNELLQQVANASEEYAQLVQKKKPSSTKT